MSRYSSLRWSALGGTSATTLVKAEDGWVVAEVFSTDGSKGQQMLRIIENAPQVKAKLDDLREQARDLLHESIQREHLDTERALSILRQLAEEDV